MQYVVFKYPNGQLAVCDANLYARLFSACEVMKTGTKEVCEIYKKHHKV